MEWEDAGNRDTDFLKTRCQKAVAMVLEAVYEQDFFDCKYGWEAPRRHGSD